MEVKKLCQAHRGPNQKSPFTGVFVFESTIYGSTLFNAVKSLSLDERADFVLILNSVEKDEASDSIYFSHWH